MSNTISVIQKLLDDCQKEITNLPRTFIDSYDHILLRGQIVAYTNLLKTFCSTPENILNINVLKNKINHAKCTLAIVIYELDIVSGEQSNLQIKEQRKVLKNLLDELCSHE